MFLIVIWAHLILNYFKFNGYFELMEDLLLLYCVLKVISSYLAASKFIEILNISDS